MANQFEAKPAVFVVGIDYSELSDRALTRACEVVSPQRLAHLHVIHVASAADADEAASQDAELQRTSERLYTHVENVLRSWCEVHSVSLPFARVTTHVRGGAAAEAIAQLAADVEAEVIIIGTHGRRGARRFILGSVAEGTVRLASCDVLVTRPPDAGIPQIEPACPRCIETRRLTNGRELWCEQHRGQHGRRHTYHYSPGSPAHQSGFLIHVD